jgi:hypothetical protein
VHRQILTADFERLVTIIEKYEAKMDVGLPKRDDSPPGSDRDLSRKDDGQSR